MMKSFPRMLATLLVLAAAAAASADITAVSTTSIAEGSTFTITGTGFGKSPTVELVNGETRIALKRQKNPKASDTSLTDWKNNSATFAVPVGLLVEAHDVAVVNGSGDAGNAR